MAERFFARAIKLKNVSDYMTDLQDNQGVVKTTITTTPIGIGSQGYVVFTFTNDIPVVAKADGAVTTYEVFDDEPTWADLVAVTDGDHASGYTLTIVQQDIDMDVVGTFDVVYTATDASGNTSEEFTLEITIEDTTVPVITDSVGDTSYATGTAEPDWTVGVTALDEYDGDITSDIVVTDTAVDMTTVGTFDVSYDVDDSSGNSAVTVTRTITITE